MRIALGDTAGLIGELQPRLDVTRLDGPGGKLAVKAAFSNATRQLDLDVGLQEPAGGVVATLLNIEGKPAIDLRVQGSGPLDQVDVNFSLDAGGGRIAEGVVALRSTDEGLGFTVRTEEAGGYLGLGYVFSSDPAAGDDVPRGSTITLFLI